MKKHIVTVVVALVVGIAAFVGGMQYGKGSAALTPQAFQNMSPQERQQFFQSSGGGRSGQRGGGNGGLLSGDVVAKDSESITVKTRDGSSRVVFYASSTSVTKPSPASMDDVAVGGAVTVTGSQNSDGSFTAQSIQVRERNQQ